jgi:hypothetical protein
MALGLATYSGGAIWFYFSSVPSQNLPSGTGSKGTPMADEPIIAPNNSGIITHNQSGGQNTVNNYGPPQRHISAETADLVATQLHAIGPHTVALVDFSGGTNQEVSAYTRQLAQIIEAAGWTIESGAPKTFLPVGGVPATGMHFLFRTDAEPSGAEEMLAVLSRNGVAIDHTYSKFPALVDDDAVIGIAVGYAPQ